METPFDRMFDFDSDGRLDILEKSARDVSVINVLNALKKGRKEDSDRYEDDADDDSLLR